MIEKQKGFLLRAAAIGIAVLLGACSGGGGGTLSYEEAVDELSGKLDGVDWREDLVQRRANVQLETPDLAESLPAIDEFPLVVQPPTSSDDVVVEIFVSTEKSGEGTDGWMVEVAQKFNDENQRLSGGQGAKVQIRKIASGIGYQFISSGKHQPQAFSPSNHLWIQMSAESGAKMTPVRETLVGNVAGVVMKTDVADELETQYGSLDVANIIDAVVQGRIVMGYTNPFASSTGLNFLVAILATFSEGQEDRMLSPDVVSAFERFQKGVPFVALTTLQIRESVEKGGSLDAFVMEYQTYVKTDTLQSGFEFIPFGITHDNPLYGVGDVSPAELEVLEQFAAFAEQAEFTELATDYGFNPSLQYDPPFEIPSGGTLVQAQRLWKEKKDAGRPVVAVFVADVSGSMQGAKMNRVQEALIAGSEFITPENSIGLVLFNDGVSVVLPIEEFDLNQKAAFVAAVEDIDASGGTAMYDAIAVALSQLVAEKERDPNVKPIMFVLTDGETRDGMSFDSMDGVVEGLGIPIYTIGFEADLDELARLSSIVEAASINAGEGDVEYKIGEILNAEL